MTEKSNVADSTSVFYLKRIRLYRLDKLRPLSLSHPAHTSQWMNDAVTRAAIKDFPWGT